MTNGSRMTIQEIAPSTSSPRNVWCDTEGTPFQNGYHCCSLLPSDCFYYHDGIAIARTVFFDRFLRGLGGACRIFFASIDRRTIVMLDAVFERPQDATDFEALFCDDQGTMQ